MSRVLAQRHSALAVPTRQELEALGPGDRWTLEERLGDAQTLLARCLETYRAAFGEGGDAKEGRQASIIKGLGAFWLLYPDADLEGVIKSIAELSPMDLYNKGRQRKEDLRLTNLYGGIIDVIRNRYNRGRRSGRLPERRVGKGGVGSWIE